MVFEAVVVVVVKVETVVTFVMFEVVVVFVMVIVYRVKSCDGSGWL